LPPTNVQAGWAPNIKPWRLSFCRALRYSAARSAGEPRERKYSFFAPLRVENPFLTVEEGRNRRRHWFWTSFMWLASSMSRATPEGRPFVGADETGPAQRFRIGSLSAIGRSVVSARQRIDAPFFVGCPGDDDVGHLDRPHGPGCLPVNFCSVDLGAPCPSKMLDDEFLLLLSCRSEPLMRGADLANVVEVAHRALWGRRGTGLAGAVLGETCRPRPWSPRLCRTQGWSMRGHSRPPPENRITSETLPVQARHVQTLQRARRTIPASILLRFAGESRKRPLPRL